jgi:hypothetical protein
MLIFREFILAGSVEVASQYIPISMGVKSCLWAGKVFTNLSTQKAISSSSNFRPLIEEMKSGMLIPCKNESSVIPYLQQRLIKLISSLSSILAILGWAD